MVSGLISGRVDDMDFEAVETALRDGSREAVRRSLETRLESGEAGGDLGGGEVIKALDNLRGACFR